MLKLITISLAMTLYVLAPAQERTKEYYRVKAKKQKTLGIVLLAGGVVTSFVGLSQLNFAGSRDGHVNNTPGAVLFFTGLVAAITSFPVLKAAKRNRHKAMLLSLRYDAYPGQPLHYATLSQGFMPSLHSACHQAGSIKNSRTVAKTIPAVSIKINF